jgi:Fe-S cluster biogenesis protein NfuA
MFMRSQLMLGAALLRSELAARCCEGVSAVLNASCRPALRSDGRQVLQMAMHQNKQGHFLGTFACRLQGMCQGSSTHSLQHVAHPSNTALFNIPGFPRGRMKSWSARGRTMSTLTPENAVYGILAVCAEHFVPPLVHV